MGEKLNVVMLCGHGKSSRIMFNGIKSYVNVECVIVENKPSGKALILRRLKNLGLNKVIGQLLFILINKLLARRSKWRVNQLMHEYELDDRVPPDNISVNVNSVNDDDTIKLLKKINPDAIVVNGTRIIAKKVLASVSCPFINTHMGITHKYRGVHGGYWALAMGDKDNCGVTVHLVDQGIDTGGILYQDIISVTKDDNFNTYPIHQIAKAVPLMKQALDDVKHQNVSVIKGVCPSYLWHHPTIYEYMKYLFKNGIK